MGDLLERLQAGLADRYRVVRELGQGGMAVVFLAEDLKHHRRAALKVLRPELATAVGHDRFLREIGIAAGLAHPHILPLYDSGETAGLVYYVMPYVEGESLGDRLRREGRLPVNEALRIAAEVADALAYAHGAGLVHRDVKPENILFQGGHAVVADFGVARAMDTAGAGQITEVGLALGTPVYMSPEQAAADAIDGRSDVYALGCVLSEMLAGEPPYTGDTARAILARHALEAIPSVRARRPEVSAAVDAAIVRAMGKAPGDRWAGAAEFGAVLRTLATGAEPAGAWVPHRRWIARGALAVAGLVVLIGIVALLRADPSRIAILRTLLTRAGPRLHANRVVVAPFVNATGDTALEALGDLAADWVAHGLAGVGVEVVDARTAQIASRVVQEIPRVLRRADRAMAIAEETGAATVIWGSYYRTGDSLRVQSQLTDVATGKLVRPMEPVSAPAGEPEALVERLSQETIAALAVARDTILTGIVGGSRPPRYESYREMSRGMESFFRVDFADARERLTRAVALDSGAVLPALALTYVLEESHLWAEAHNQLARLDAMRAGADPLEQAYVDLLRAIAAGDAEGRLRAGREALRLSPASIELAVQVAVSAVHANRPREAIDVLARTDPERGLLLVSDVYWSWLTAAQHQLGAYERELRDARQGRRRFPAAWHSAYSELRALAARDPRGEFARRLERATLRPDRTLFPGGPVLLGMQARLQLAEELRTHGKPQAATALAWQLAHELVGGSVPDSYHRRAMLARVRYFHGQWDEARVVAEGLVRDDPADVQARGLLGAIAARRGDRAAAERAAAVLAASRAPYLFGRASYERARIAALLGDRAGAVALLRAALEQGLRAWTWFGEVDLHTDMDFDGLRDDAAFRELVRPK